MNRDKFFAGVRASVFGGKLAQSQVDGVNAILDACEAEQVTDPRHIAYPLATPMIETGGTFIPIIENLNYSVSALTSKFGNRITAAQASQYGRSTAHPADQKAIANIIYGGAWGLKNLGNTKPTDGWDMRGRGLPQLTGRRLYEIFGYANNPDAVADIMVSADIMVKAMKNGTFTGKKLSDYLGAKTDFVGARHIVNGTDRAEDIAAYAVKFLVAIEAAQ